MEPDTPFLPYKPKIIRRIKRKIPKVEEGYEVEEPQPRIKTPKIKKIAPQPKIENSEITSNSEKPKVQNIVREPSYA